MAHKMKKKRRVKILAPITSFEAAQGVISAGVDEVYCGVKVPNTNYMGLSMRLDSCSLSTYDVLKRVANYAHEHGVRILTTTEFPFMAELIENKIRKHIISLVKCGIDALIVTDLGILLMVKNMSLDIPVYASTYLASMNYKAVDLLKELGVKRVILERQLTIEEIRAISRIIEDVEIEVFVHGPGCSNINRSCYGCPNVNVVDESLRRRGVTITSMCKTTYKIYEVEGKETRSLGRAPILDAYAWCSLCKLPDLLETGVTGFKIVGRCADRDYQEQVTRIYCELVDLLECGDEEAFKDRLEVLRTNKYVVGGCNQERCYYHSLLHAPYKIVQPVMS